MVRALVTVALSFAATIPVAAQPAPAPAYAPGRLVIKIVESVGVGLDELERRNQAPGFSGTRIDALHRRFGAHDLRPLRRVDRAALTLPERRVAERWGSWRNTGLSPVLQESRTRFRDRRLPSPGSRSRSCER